MAALRTMEIVWNPAREDALRLLLDAASSHPDDQRFDAVFLLRNEGLSITDGVFSPDFKGVKDETTGRVAGLVADAVDATGLPTPPASLQARMTFLRILAERQKEYTLVGMAMDSPSNHHSRKPIVTGLDLLVNGTSYKCTYLESPPTATEGQQARVELEIKKRLLREVAFWKWTSPLLRKALVRIESRPDPSRHHKILGSLVDKGGGRLPAAVY